jgi:hypothetical protein
MLTVRVCQAIWANAERKREAERSEPSAGGRHWTHPRGCVIYVKDREAGE